MIIRDLDHYEIHSQTTQIEKVEGGFTREFAGFLAVRFDSLNTGFFTQVEGTADTINQQGSVNPFNGRITPTVTGFSFSLNSLVSSVKF